MLVFDGTTRGIVDLLVRLNNNIVQGFPVPAIHVVRTTDIALAIDACPYPLLPTVDDLGCASLLSPDRIGRHKRRELLRVHKESRPSHELHDRAWLDRHRAQGHKVLWGKGDLSGRKDMIEHLKRIAKELRRVHPERA